MKFGIGKPTEPHIVFAWLPVLVFDRSSNTAWTVWLERVERRMVSVQGSTFFVYGRVPTLK